MNTNVFMNYTYEQPENRLTYSFLCVIKHLSPESLSKVLKKVGLNGPTNDEIAVEGVQGGQETNPDGIITFNPGSESESRIYLENKTWRRPLDLNQIRGHIRIHLRDTKNSLLVITSNRADNKKLGALIDSRIRFIAWSDLVDFLHELAPKTSDERDAFLLEQFVEYAEKSGEAWRAKMIDRKYIEAASQQLKIKDDFSKFLGNGWQLMDSVRQAIGDKLRQSFEAQEMVTRWGIVGVHCKARVQTFGVELYFGIYFKTDDCRVNFKKQFQPEFAIFLDIAQDRRIQVAGIEGILDSVKSLKEQGFEFNFPEDSLKRPEQLCYWHDPMIDHLNDELADLTRMFEVRLSLLFGSEFFRRLTILGQ